MPWSPEKMPSAEAATAVSIGPQRGRTLDPLLLRRFSILLSRNQLLDCRITRLQRRVFPRRHGIAGIADASRHLDQILLGEQYANCSKPVIFEMCSPRMGRWGPDILEAPGFRRRPNDSFGAGRCLLRECAGALVRGRILGALRFSVCQPAAPPWRWYETAYVREPGRYGGQPVGTAPTAQQHGRARGSADPHRRRNPGKMAALKRIFATRSSSASSCSTISRRSISLR